MLLIHHEWNKETQILDLMVFIHVLHQKTIITGPLHRLHASLVLGKCPDILLLWLHCIGWLWLLLILQSPAMKASSRALRTLQIWPVSHWQIWWCFWCGWCPHALWGLHWSHHYIHANVCVVVVDCSLSKYTPVFCAQPVLLVLNRHPPPFPPPYFLSPLSWSHDLWFVRMMVMWSEKPVWGNRQALYASLWFVKTRSYVSVPPPPEEECVRADTAEAETNL